MNLLKILKEELSKYDYPKDLVEYVSTDTLNKLRSQSQSDYNHDLEKSIAKKWYSEPGSDYLPLP